MPNVRLSELSANDLDYLELKKALVYPARARSVEVRKPDPALAKLARVYRLMVTGNPPPSVGNLRHLRVLKLRGRVTDIPTCVFELPNLEELYLEDATVSVKALAGLAKSPSLRTIALGRLKDEHPEEIKALLTSVPGAELGFLGVEIARKPRPVPKGKAALAKALRDDMLDPAGADLRKVDLRGVVIEDAFAESWDLRGADLSGTTWKRCDLRRVKMDGAKLEKATFEDCCARSVTMTKAKARDVVFRRCELQLDLSGADVRGAKLTELETGPRLELAGANAQGMQLEAFFHEESSIDVSARKADLRGARIVFDVYAERRDELTKKKNTRVRWKKGQFAGSKQDATTSIVYTPLPGSKEEAAARGRPAPSTTSLVDDRGTFAPALGRIDSINAGLWVLAIDGAAATVWRGDDPKEFDRALATREGAFAVGGARGVIATVGDYGWSYIFGVDGGVALTSHRRSGHAAKMPKSELAKALGRRVAQLTLPAKPRRVGTFDVTSGCLALMLPYTRGSFSAKQLEAAKKKLVDVGGDRVLVPVPNGTYEVLTHAFGPKDYEDELGSYEAMVRIVRSGAGAASGKQAKVAASTSPAPVRKATTGKGRRFELVEGASSKFWEIRLDGAAFTTTYGKIGTGGQSTTKAWPSAEKARAEHDKLVAEKTRKGYVEA